jgi:hypothetical protein
MDDFFSSGRVADLALVVLAVEAAGLVLLRRSGRGPPLASVLPFLAAGAFLLLALRGALTGASWPAIALPLALAGLAHAIDLRGRLRGPR